MGSLIKENGQGGDTPAARLSTYCVDFNLNHAPSAVIDHAKLLLLDLMGAALAGVETAEAKAAAKAISMIDAGGGHSTIWGTAQSANPAAAALVNGIAAHARELDDFGGVDHSGAVVIPAIIALGEALPVLSGRCLLEGMIVGYEIGRRVLDACGGYRPHNHEDGWHSTGTCGSFAAAAAAAKVLGLDAERSMWALGLAGSFTGGTWAFLKDGAMSKRYHAGRAAETGVTAACLAKAGFSGPAHIFEAEWGGFFKTYARAASRPEKLVQGLGRDFGILCSGVKPYASCRDIHSTLDVILDARQEYGLRPADIDRIDVRCIPEMKQMVGRTASPKTRLEAQLSLPYSVGVALTTGAASLGEFEEPWLNHPEVKRLAGCVNMEVDPQLPFDSEPYITIYSRDGRSITGHVDHARGAPQNPLGREVVEEKYNSLASRALPKENVARLREMIFTVETLEDIRVLTHLLRL